MKRLTEDSILGHALSWVARMIFRHRRAVIVSAAALCIVSVWYTYTFLNFDTNRNNLVGANKKYQHAFLEFKKEFPQQDDLAVVVESGDSEKNRQFVERLAAKLETQTDYFTNLIYKNDLKMLGPKALLFVPKTNLVDLRDQLRVYGPFVQKFAQTTNLVSFFNLVNTQFRTSRAGNQRSKLNLWSKHCRRWSGLFHRRMPA